ASFGKFRAARQWPPELLDHLGLAVRLFGSAIERKQSVTAMRAVRAELRLARLLTQGNPQPAMALEAVNSAIEDTKRTAEIVRRIRFMFKRHDEHKTA